MRNHDDTAPMVPMAPRTPAPGPTARPDGGRRRRFERPIPTEGTEDDQHREAIEPMVPDMR